MKSRLAASAAISALVLLGATGCTFITPQATTISFSASDGVNIDGFDGPLDIRNVMIIAEEDGSDGNLVAAIVNDSDERATLVVEVDGLDPIEIRVDAGETVSLGATDEPIFLPDLNTLPGSTVSVYFQAGDAQGATAEVPVLDGSLPYYADLVPSETIQETTDVDVDDADDATTDEADVTEAPADEATTEDSES